MNLIDEVVGYAKANADAAKTADERQTWEAHHRNCVKVQAEIARLRLVIAHEADCTEAADDEAMRRGHEIEQLLAALWPFAMKALHGTEVCADDYRRAGEAMPNAPDHMKG